MFVFGKLAVSGLYRFHLLHEGIQCGAVSIRVEIVLDRKEQIVHRCGYKLLGQSLLDQVFNHQTDHIASASAVGNVKEHVVADVLRMVEVVNGTKERFLLRGRHRYEQIDEILILLQIVVDIVIFAVCHHMSQNREITAVQIIKLCVSVQGVAEGAVHVEEIIGDQLREVYEIVNILDQSVLSVRDLIGKLDRLVVEVEERGSILPEYGTARSELVLQGNAVCDQRIQILNIAGQGNLSLPQIGNEGILILVIDVVGIDDLKVIIALTPRGHLIAKHNVAGILTKGRSVHVSDRSRDLTRVIFQVRNRPIRVNSSHIVMQLCHVRKDLSEYHHNVVV